MKSSLKTVETLPELNLTDSFIVTKKAKKSLKEDWLSYIEFMQDKAFAKESTFKNLKGIVKERKPYSEMSLSARRVFGFEGKLKVIHHMSEKYSYKTRLEMTYEGILKLYFDEKNETTGGMHIRLIIDRFFAYQWSRGKLLYSMNNRPHKYRRAENWHEFVVHQAPIFKLLDKAYTSNLKDAKTKTLSKSSFYSVLSCTNWTTTASISEDSLQEMHALIKLISPNHRGKEIHLTRVINEIRSILIDEGRKDIKTPREAIVERSGGYHTIEKVKEKLHGAVDGCIVNFTQLLDFANDYIDKQNNDGLGTYSIRKIAASIRMFLEYCDAKYPLMSIDMEIVDEMFDPSNKDNLIVYLTKNQGSKENAISYINMLVPFLLFCDLYSLNARKNTPKNKTKTKVLPYRAAMPRNMVLHIIDIIKNRPPNAPTRWKKDKADISWWRHEVYPIFPLMQLFHYCIPVRGGQVRNLCRENSFVFDKDGNIDTFIINTDKNVNRAYLQEVPCVWDDLQIYVPFLKWHKEYFPYIPKVKYHEDDNSPWQDIEPLMVIPSSMRPMTHGTHFDYHKRVLCKYQLEIMKIAEKNGDNNYKKIAWNKKNKPFFNTIEEIDKATTEKMIDIDVMYDIHSIRVTGATRYLEAGVGMKVVMELTGHMSEETLVRVYIQLTKDEKKIKLKTAVDKIFMGDKETLVDNGQIFVNGELTRAYEYGEESMKNALENNSLFSIFRKAYSTNENKILKMGTQIALEIHPSGWFPMIHGICPGVKCPEGRENKCSLCPYLITGKLFMEGIVHQSNLAFVRFQRESLDMQLDDEKGYKNQKRSEGIETMLEELLGWNEILQKIENDMMKDDSTIVSSKSLVSGGDNTEKKIFMSKPVETELAYLHNAYDAKLIGVEHDRHGLKILTIKAMKIAAEMGDMEKLKEVSEDENKAIDHLMSYYTDKLSFNSDAKNLVGMLKKLPNPTKKLK